MVLSGDEKAMSTLPEEDKEQRIAALNMSVSKAQAALSRLDQEYDSLDKQEKQLLQVMERLHKEENCLSQALEEASETGADRLARDRQEREHAAVARLEMAMFDCDESDRSSYGDGKESGGNV